MPQSPLTWAATGLMALSAAFSIVIALETLWGQAGLPHQQRMAQEVMDVMAENDGLRRKLLGLEREVAAQRERPEVQEALVRDLLGYVQKDDVILRLDPGE